MNFGYQLGLTMGSRITNATIMRTDVQLAPPTSTTTGIFRAAVPDVQANAHIVQVVPSVWSFARNLPMIRVSWWEMTNQNRVALKRLAAVFRR
jgi:hypothetical protein